MSRSTVAMLAAALCLTMSVQAQGATKTENYVLGPVGDTDGLCRLDPLNPTGLNLGTVCFKDPAGTRGRLTIVDASMAPVGGNYVFLNSAGTAIGSAIDFCGTVSNIGIPASADKLVVYIAGAAWGPLACLDAGWPGVGTNGSVTLLSS